MKITTKIFTKDLWNDLCEVLGEEGGSEGCWCMSWRSQKELKDEVAKAALKELVEQDKVQGIIAYTDAQAVGWCTYGLRKDFWQLEYNPNFKQVSGENVYAIPCFYIKDGFRGQGISSQLLQAVCEAIKPHSQILEGYPVKPDESEENKEDWSFTGSYNMFEKNGFQPACSCQYELQCVRKKL